jgi:parallel beta-helix repeat protein
MITDNVDELEKFFWEAIENGCEGLVCKSIAKDSVYQAGARGWLWIKYKRDYKSEMTDTGDLVLSVPFTADGIYKGSKKHLDTATRSVLVDIGSAIGKVDEREVQDSDAQHVVVQVERRKIGAKEPILTTEIKIPGKYAILIPEHQVKVSRKILDWQKRSLLLQLNNVVDVSNTVDGKPIQYIIGVEDEVFDNQMNAGVLYLISCSNVTVRDLNFTGNGHGMFCYDVSDSRIENVTVSNNNYGVYLQNSINNLVSHNYCPNNWVGISLQYSRDNIVESNVASDNEKGISLYKADYNCIRGSTLQNNLYGTRFFSSSFNEIFHNNLVGNNEQVNPINSYMNVWDNGFEGNFWSNYTGSDADRDGLGGIDQIIDDNNHDRHPLLGAFHNFSVYYEGNFYDVAVISNSTILNFAFEAVNHTIRLMVNGTDETYGFSRICIPHALIEPEIAVIIDDGLTEVIYPNYALRDDGFCRWIYFAYQHSAHEILIIPEFWSMIFLSTLMVMTLWYLYFRKLEMKLRLSTLWM